MTYYNPLRVPHTSKPPPRPSPPAGGTTSYSSGKTPRRSQPTWQNQGASPPLPLLPSQEPSAADCSFCCIFTVSSILIIPLVTLTCSKMSHLNNKRPSSFLTLPPQATILFLPLHRHTSSELARLSVSSSPPIHSSPHSCTSSAYKAPTQAATSIHDTNP